MNIVSSRNIKSLHDLIELGNSMWSVRTNGFHVLFRGQSQDWPLLPTAATARLGTPFAEDLLLSDMNELLNTDSSGYVKSTFLKKPYQYELEWSLYIQARHFGLPTRLLDFSANIRTAAYFAATADFESDGVLWIFTCPDKIFAYDDRISEYLDIPIKDIPSLMAFNHPFDGDFPVDKFPAEYRKFKQNGLFVIPPLTDLQVPINEDISISKLFAKVVIPSQYKSKLEYELIKENQQIVHLTPELPQTLKNHIDQIRRKFSR